MHVLEPTLAERWLLEHGIIQEFWHAPQSRTVVQVAASKLCKRHPGSRTREKQLLAAAAVLLVAGVTLPVVAPTATAAETAYTNLVAALAVILALAALLRPPDDHR